VAVSQHNLNLEILFPKNHILTFTHVGAIPQFNLNVEIEINWKVKQITSAEHQNYDNN